MLRCQALGAFALCERNEGAGKIAAQYGQGGV